MLAAADAVAGQLLLQLWGDAGACWSRMLLRVDSRCLLEPPPTAGNMREMEWKRKRGGVRVRVCVC